VTRKVYLVYRYEIKEHLKYGIQTVSEYLTVKPKDGTFCLWPSCGLKTKSTLEIDKQQAKKIKTVNRVCGWLCYELFGKHRCRMAYAATIHWRSLRISSDLQTMTPFEVE